VDVFDVKSDTIRTLLELGLDENDLHVSSNTKNCYHPGRSGSIKLKSKHGPHLAYFGELHPAIITSLDFKEKNIFGLEIFLKNIPEPNKKLRISKENYIVSDFQKSERDFAFVIDKSYLVGDLELLIKDVDNKLIKNVIVFDIFQGQNIPEGKKSVAINVTIQASDKTLTEKDLDEVSQKIIEIVKNKTGATIRS
jgi:phenylalanyl-tRNA synthetase beta chain